VFALIGAAFFGSYQGTRRSQTVETHSAADHEHKTTHPAFLSWDWFTEDPVACATFALALFTGALFTTTVWMARGAERSSAAALKASLQNTATLIATERPYVTGGGGFVEKEIPDSTGRRFRWAQRRAFVVDVQNNGKTPALLTHYDVQFETFERVRSGPIDIAKKYSHYDWLGWGEKKPGINVILIPEDKNVVFGGFWYLDFQKREHCFRFILSIDIDTTRPDIADVVDKSYTDWT
jgi:hypothetical protein